MDDSPWAKLVKCILKENEYFPVVKSTYTIGRKAGKFYCRIVVVEYLLWLGVYDLAHYWQIAM